MLPALMASGAVDAEATAFLRKRPCFFHYGLKEKHVAVRLFLEEGCP